MDGWMDREKPHRQKILLVQIFYQDVRVHVIVILAFGGGNSEQHVYRLINHQLVYKQHY